MSLKERLKKFHKREDGLMEIVDIVLALVLIIVVGAIGIYITDTTMDATSTPLVSVAATQTLTLSNVIIDNENVTIGNIKYELNSAGAVTAGHVNVSTVGNLTATFAADALKTAINNNATSAALVTATNPTTTTVLITADAAGTTANSYATTENMANGTWGAATMTGGVDASSVGGMQTNFLNASSTGSSFIIILIIAMIGGLAISYLFGLVGKKRRG